MRGVDLSRFDFDYDLTWAGFFLNADDRVYGRFGGRDAKSADGHLTLPGLKYAMRKALDAYRREPNALPSPVPGAPRRVEEYTEGRKLKADQCIHCHQVYEFSRFEISRAGGWKKDMAWVYPPPDRVGLNLDPNQGDRVAAVTPNSPAATAGLRPGDVLRRVGGAPVASFADVQYALNRAPAAGEIPISYERGGKARTATLRVATGWRSGDLSNIAWRGSMWRLEPAASVYGDDLPAEEKRTLGLEPDALAFRQGNFVPNPARQAGIKARDIILGLEGRPFRGGMLEFNVWVRTNFEPGQTIVYQVIRNGERLRIPMTLTARDWF